ncbi:hypothetical protein MKZ38_005729 [Zalerion maritima]|uniref:Aminoglycoside phosphotransferase domain-containing protein n=1 Tax=Zalerion maritima TaxID=339359 RepID=A0AAD5RKR0_9PEZI|nr:hypothetical protein MKZ38_005729 [Zalerion maritima]
MDSKHEALYEKLLALTREGLLGPRAGKGVAANIVTEDAGTLTYIVTLVSMPPSSDAMERHLVKLQKKDGKLVSTRRLYITREDMAVILRDASLGTLKDYERLNNGAYGVTYRSSVEEPGSPEFVVQLRSHGKVQSMNRLQEYIRQEALPALPVPKVYPSLNTALAVEGLQLQITELVSGVMGDSIYYDLEMERRQVMVRQMARAFAALWELPISKQLTGIGDAIMPSDGDLSMLAIKVEPERRHGIGGPFQTVSDFLKAWIRHRFARLEAQNGIDEYKAELLPPIRQFVETSLDSALPPEVDSIPVVLMHTDMGLHNIIVSPDYPFEFRAVIDWEFTSCLPFLCAVPDLIEPLFREQEGAEGPLWEGGEELCSAFWDEIPDWKALKMTTEGRTFLEWYEFGLYLKANALLDLGAPLQTKMAFWEKNLTFVTAFLKRWSSDVASL